MALSLILIVVLVIVVILILQWIYNKMPPNIQELIRDFLRTSLK